MVGVLYAAYWWQVRAQSIDAYNPRRHAMFDRLLMIAFNFIFLIYPVVCQTIFKAFLCQDIGDPDVSEESYLSTDFQVDCLSTEYLATLATAGIMVSTHCRADIINLPCATVIAICKLRCFARV